jgi:uncharacterized membrane protein
MKEFLKDMKRPTDQMRTAWFRHGIVICAFPVAITVALVCSLAMVLYGDFGTLDQMWREFNIVLTNYWKGPSIC